MPKIDLDTLALDLRGTILSADDSGTQVLESLLSDMGTAVVALADELRTANLIAYQRNVEQSYADRAPGKPRTTDAVALNQAILERLGLK